MTFRKIVENILLEKGKYQNAAKSFLDRVNASAKGNVNPLLGWDKDAIWFGMPEKDPSNNDNAIPNFDKTFKINIDNIETDSDNPLIPIQEVDRRLITNRNGIDAISNIKIGQPILIPADVLLQIINADENRSILNRVMRNNTTSPRSMDANKWKSEFDKNLNLEKQELLNFYLENKDEIADIKGLTGLEQKLQAGTYDDEKDNAIRMLKKVKTYYERGYAWELIKEMFGNDVNSYRDKEVYNVNNKLNKVEDKLDIVNAKLDILDGITQEVEKYPELKDEFEKDKSSLVSFYIYVNDLEGYDELKALLEKAVSGTMAYRLGATNTPRKNLYTVSNKDNGNYTQDFALEFSQYDNLKKEQSDLLDKKTSLEEELAKLQASRSDREKASNAKLYWSVDDPKINDLMKKFGLH